MSIKLHLHPMKCTRVTSAANHTAEP